MSGRHQKPRGQERCAVMQALWVYALAKAGGDPRPFVWETYPMRFVPAAKA